MCNITEYQQALGLWRMLDMINAENFTLHEEGDFKVIERDKITLIIDRRSIRIHELAGLYNLVEAFLGDFGYTIDNLKAYRGKLFGATTWPEGTEDVVPQFLMAGFYLDNPNYWTKKSLYKDKRDVHEGNTGIKKRKDLIFFKNRVAAHVFVDKKLGLPAKVLEAIKKY